MSLDYTVASATVYQSHYLYAEAEALLRTALTEGERVELIECLCLQLASQFKYDEALALEKRVSSLGGDASVAQARIALIAWMKGDLGGAARHLKSICDSGDRDYYLLVFGEIALNYVGNAKYALQILNRIGTDSDHAISSAAIKAKAYVTLNNKPAAQAALEECWPKDPWNAYVLSAKRLFEGTFQTEFAPTSQAPPPPNPWDYSRLPVVPKDKSPRSLHNLAITAYREKRNPECIDFCNKALALSSTVLDIYFLRSLAYYQLKKYDLAEEDIRYLLDNGRGKYNNYGMYVGLLTRIALNTFQIGKVVEMQVAYWRFKRDSLRMYLTLIQLFARIG